MINIASKSKGIKDIEKRKNERKTEGIVRNILNDLGYNNKELKLLVEEQKSDKPNIVDLLSEASKRLTGNEGYPEFIISKNSSSLIIVIECKPTLKEHKSKNLDKPDKYAIDGVLHYARFLKKDFNVIAIAVSGSKKESIKIDTYLWKENEQVYSDLEWHEFRTYMEYEAEIEKQSGDFKVNEEILMEYAKQLHNEMRDYGKISESEKPLVVSGILIALHNEAFRRNYKTFDSDDISKETCNSIEKVLKKANIPETKRETLMTVWNFITSREEFRVVNGNIGENLLTYFIDKIYKNVRTYINPNYSIDVLGKFYGEFLRYTGGDGKGLGIVLTPHHVTDLFVRLGNLTTDSVVLDTCAGTGGFLISAMKDMFEKAHGDEDAIQRIKKYSLIGVEQQTNMYALACANMILRGDGKSNLYLGSCFSEDIKSEIKSKKPNIGFINPPYSQNAEGLSEFDYILNILDCLEKNSLCFAIVPMGCACSTNAKTIALKEKILESNTLEAVMSMPNELFSPTNTITCIMVFRAGITHSPDLETWFAYWKDDGFVKTKHKGRIDKLNKWSDIEKEWVKMFINKREVENISLKQSVTAVDEWCVEAYMKTDYTQLDEELFQQKLKEYLIFKLMNEIK